MYKNDSIFRNSTIIEEIIQVYGGLEIGSIFSEEYFFVLEDFIPML